MKKVFEIGGIDTSGKFNPIKAVLSLPQINSIMLMLVLSIAVMLWSFQAQTHLTGSTELAKSSTLRESACQIKNCRLYWILVTVVFVI